MYLPMRSLAERRALLTREVAGAFFVGELPVEHRPGELVELVGGYRESSDDSAAVFVIQGVSARSEADVRRAVRLDPQVGDEVPVSGPHAGVPRRCGGGDQPTVGDGDTPEGAD